MVESDGRNVTSRITSSLPWARCPAVISSRPSVPVLFPASAAAVRSLAYEVIACRAMTEGRLQQRCALPRVPARPRSTDDHVNPEDAAIDSTGRLRYRLLRVGGPAQARSGGDRAGHPCRGRWCRSGCGPAGPDGGCRCLMPRWGVPRRRSSSMEDVYGVPEHRIFSSQPRTTSFRPRRPRGDGAGKSGWTLCGSNSLAGDILRETWESVSGSLGASSRSVNDITSSYQAPEMSKFDLNATFSSGGPNGPGRGAAASVMASTFRAVMNLFEPGCLRPSRLSPSWACRRSRPLSGSCRAGKTVGKLVVVPQPGEQVRGRAARRFTGSELFRADGTYMIVGGTGGLGRSISGWMVGKGARNIVLLSQRPRRRARLRSSSSR